MVGYKYRLYILIMKYHHLLTLLTAAGILLPAQQATAFTSPLPELADGISLAPKKNKKGKKGKTTKGKRKKAEQSNESVARKIFNATDEQKQKAKAFLEQQGNPDLETAIKEDNDKAVVAHLVCGASAQDALKLAILANKPKYVKICIDAPGIDVNKNTPLAYAASQGQIECVKLLLNAPGINVNEADLDYGVTALDYAISGGNEEMVKLLLRMPGINVNAIDSYGNTPLGNAARYGTPEMVKLLINAPGFDASAWNPITLAVLQNDIAQLKSLIQAKKDVNKADARGITPLHWAVLADRIECLRILVKVPGLDANTAVVEEGRVFQKPTANGIEVEEVDTALHTAAADNKPECIKLLLTIPGINPNITAGKIECTPLYRSFRNRNLECFKLLASDPRVDVNIPVPSWANPTLHQAVFEGEIEYVKILLSNPKIDMKAYPCDNKTPLQTATQEGHTEIIKLLKEAGAK